MLSETTIQAREAARLDDEYDRGEEEAWERRNYPELFKCAICKHDTDDHALSCPTRWYR